MCDTSVNTTNLTTANWKWSQLADRELKGTGVKQLCLRPDLHCKSIRHQILRPFRQPCLGRVSHLIGDLWGST